MLYWHNLFRRAGAKKEQWLTPVGIANVTQLLEHYLSRKAGAQKEQGEVVITKGVGIFFGKKTAVL
jgi:hypothetical protein